MTKQNQGAVGVAIVGAGFISTQYLDTLSTFPDLAVRVIADRDPDAARRRAEQYGIAESGPPELALGHSGVEIVVNLTVPAAHADVDLAAIQAGKHVWSEKPLALGRDEARTVLTAARTAGVRVGCAPDSVLGAGIQSARRAIERGDIGTPLTAITLFQVPGPESWHPRPEFLYQRGGGPLLDHGPYYLSALVHLLGGVRRVAATGSASLATRVIGTGPRAGEEFPVEVLTHVSAITEFESGASAISVFSFESPLARRGFFEVTGTEGVLSVPDPNLFDGPLRIFHPGDEEWSNLPTTGPSDGRGLGVLDMARSIREGSDHLASGDLAYHVLDVMLAIEESIDAASFVDVASSAPDLRTVPADWAPRAPTISKG
ncbi:Inositol 2-dehydrogenase/D-chiro-inositol 3-dehydrogenase [Propionicimonas sp. T2.31MG-18]|uniref:Gfo/Idh/MocA family protein n=1 Tax=Propionicimonas sp. T2.31MG-18 TaxID=3157620 RepID=UPI0035EF3CD4